MTVVRRSNPDAGASIFLGAGSAEPAAVVGQTRVYEARWLVSRRAVQRSRPDLRLGGSGQELRFSWHLHLKVHDRTWTLVEAHATLYGGAVGMDHPLARIHGSTAGVATQVLEDPRSGTISVEIARDGVSLLSCCIGAGSGYRILQDGSRAAELAYARTTLLGGSSPGGLGIRGGRYEFDGAFVGPLANR